MLVTMLVSVQLFHAPITPQLVIAVTLVGISTLQYNLPKPALLGEWDEHSDETKKLMSPPREAMSNESDESDDPQGRVPMVRLDGVGR